ALLGVRPDCRIRASPEVLKQTAICGIERRIWKRERWLQSVKQSGINLCDHQLLNCASGTSIPHGPLRHAITLNEVFLEHHQCLALKNRVAMLLVDQLSRDGIGEPTRKIVVVERCRRLICSLIVLSSRAAAERERQPAIPALAGCPLSGRMLRSGIVENCNPVD